MNLTTALNTEAPLSSSSIQQRSHSSLLHQHRSASAVSERSISFADITEPVGLSKTESYSQQINNDFSRIRWLQYINMLISFSVATYYLITDNPGKAAQFWQIAFISVTLIIMTTGKLWRKRCLLGAAICITSGWTQNILVGALECKDYLSNPGYYVIQLAVAFCLFGGMLFVGYNVKEDYKHCGVDLYIYLFAMNAICFFKNDNFDETVHMLLDIRILMVLFKALKSIEDLSKLLYYPTFLLVFVLEVVCYVVGDAFHDSCQSFAATCALYILLGIVLWVEGLAYIYQSSSGNTMDGGAKSEKIIAYARDVIIPAGAVNDEEMH